MTKLRILELADLVCHRACDWYITAKPFGRHFPGWGRIQLWQWYLCQTYCREYDRVYEEESP